MKYHAKNAIIGTLLMISFMGCSSPQNSAKNESENSSLELVDVSLGSTRNVHQLGDVWFGGQPSAEDIDLIKDAGIKTVVNLRHDAENEGLNEAAAVTAAGMNYSHIPFANPDQLTDEVFDRVRRKLKNAPRPLFLHCASANRVGATWLPYRVLDEDVPFDQALAEAKELGLRSQGYVTRARQYIEAQQSN